VDALALVPAAERAQMLGERAERVRGWLAELDDGSAWQIGEAARNLADLACTEQDWDALLPLLTHARPAVATAAADMLLRKRRWSQAPERVTAALAGIEARSARWMLTALEFMRVGVPDLLSGTPERYAPRLPELSQRLGWLADTQRARLVPLLTHADGELRAAVAAALGYALEVPGPETAAKLWDLLDTQDEAAANVALALLARIHGNEPSKLARIAPWLTRAATAGAALELTAAQTRFGADLGALALTVVDALDGPHARIAERTLDAQMVRARPRALIERMLIALAKGNGHVAHPLLTAGLKGDLTPFEAYLRAIFDRAELGSQQRSDAVALLVHVCAERPGGLAEWVLHADPAVAKAALWEARGYSAEPFFDHLVALQAKSYGARAWLVRWGLRTPENARRLLAALPKAPSLGDQGDWRSLEQRSGARR
jgi:hypothetical protein